MERYYRAMITKTPPHNNLRDWNSVSIRFESRSLSNDWAHQHTSQCTGFDRAQDIAEQFRLRHDIADFSFDVVVDTRG
jgi:hypothetical protein